MYIYIYKKNNYIHDLKSLKDIDFIEELQDFKRNGWAWMGMDGTSSIRALLEGFEF
jgi:hypothetical protein